MATVGDSEVRRNAEGDLDEEPSEEKGGGMSEDELQRGGKEQEDPEEEVRRPKLLRDAREPTQKREMSMRRLTFLFVPGAGSASRREGVTGHTGLKRGQS